MAFTINVQDDLARVRRRVGALGRQVPFAMATALNDVAFGGRRVLVQDEWPDSIQSRNRRFIGAALRVKRARKADLEAEIFDHLGRDFLMRLAEGGVKTPRGQNVAVPTELLKGRRTGRGVPSNMRPRQALARPNVFRRKLSSGTEVIMERTKTQGTRVLYVLTPRASVPRYWQPHDAVFRYVKRNLASAFARAWVNANRTAR